MQIRWSRLESRTKFRCANGERTDMLAPAVAVAVSQLADEPRPPESFPYGSPDLRRLRAERYRVFYAVDEERRVVRIGHVGRLP